MSFYRETLVKAVRKQCHCDGCGKIIEAGSPALRYAGKFDGDFGSFVHHPECRDAECALNKLHICFDDDWMAPADIESDDHEWLLAEHPIVAERFGITADTIVPTPKSANECAAIGQRQTPNVVPGLPLHPWRCVMVEPIAFAEHECEQGGIICEAWDSWFWASVEADPACDDEDRDPLPLQDFPFFIGQCFHVKSCPLRARAAYLSPALEGRS